MEIIERNNIVSDEIVSIFFTATQDLDQAYPAKGVRELGYTDIPLMCFQEMNVVDSLEKCIRVLIYINRDCAPGDIQHVYLKKAKYLRPDLVKE